MTTSDTDLNPEQRAWLAEQERLETIWPYIAGPPDAGGERRAFCPLHDDHRPSMSINLEKSCWYCHAGCGGGRIVQLLDAIDTWIPIDRSGGAVRRG